MPPMSWLLAPALGLVAAMPHGIVIDHGTLLPAGVQSSGLAPSRITSAAKVHDFLERAHCGTGQSTIHALLSQKPIRSPQGNAHDPPNRYQVNDCLARHKL